jgi:hypothetical protein
MRAAGKGMSHNVLCTYSTVNFKLLDRKQNFFSINRFHERQAGLNMRDETAAAVQYTLMVINLNIVFNQWNSERSFT